MTLKLFTFVVLVVCAHAQQPGTQKPETHPQLSIQLCTKSGCQTQQKSVTLDANWRWLHNVGGYTNCFTGSGAGSNNVWNKQYCPDAKTCAQKCALDGADYPGTYGVHAQGNSLKLDFVIPGQYGTDVGSRVYLMDSESQYFMFKLKNKEFTFDVDVSNLPCGLNGALYMVQMDADGGTARFPVNKAGAKYGTGYCDAQCPHDIKFINGEANLENWNTTSATGMYGTCCSEMDIWEANSISTAYTPHACSVSQQTRCSGVQCGDDNKNQRHQGVCDKDGCDFNPYRLGDHTFFGPSGDAIDTTQKVTVITQFITADGSDTGDLKEIRRVWRQNGKTIQSRNVTVGGGSFNSVSDPFCSVQKKAFGDPNDFSKHGGIKQMGAAMDKGMVLAMSLWDDHAAYMLWLDSDYPLTKPANAPGVARGTCATTSGRPSDVEKNHPHASVTYSNIKFGDLGSTL